jgi:hypothetical protein
VVQRLERQLERRTVKIDDPNSKFTREEMRSYCSSLRGEGTANLLKRCLRASSIEFHPPKTLPPGHPTT